MQALDLPPLEATTREYALQLLNEDPQPISTSDRLALLRTAVDVIAVTFPKTLINEHRRAASPTSSDPK